MPSEAERVRPAAQLEVLQLRPAPELPCRQHEPLEMGPHIEFGKVRFAQSMVEATEGIGRLGGVLGDVCGDRSGRRRVEGDVAHVDLLAPADVAGDALGRGIREACPLGGSDHCLFQPLERETLGRWISRAVWSVESYDDVKVNESSVLVLDHLGVGEPGMVGEAGDRYVQPLGQLPPDRNGGSPPQLGGVCVPQDCAGVIEAVGAQRISEAVVVEPMRLATVGATAVRTRGSPSRMTDPSRTVPRSLRVDRAEARRRQGQE